MTKNYCWLFCTIKGPGKEKEPCVVFVIFLSSFFFFLLLEKKIAEAENEWQSFEEEEHTMQQYKSNLNYHKLLNTEQTKVLCSSKELLNVCCGSAGYKTDTCRLRGQKQYEPSGMLSFHLQEGDADSIHGFYLQFSTCEQ